MWRSRLRGHDLLTSWRNFARKSSSAAAVDATGFYDVIVAGSGMVGIAMACALGTSPKLANKRVLLLDAKSLKSHLELSSTYSNRVSAFSPSSKRLLEDLGVWNHICDMRQKPVKLMHVWDACSDAAITFGPMEHFQDDNVAYLVENNVTVTALLKRIRELTQNERVNLRDSVRVDKYEIPTRYDQGRVKVHLQRGQVIETDLLIGSDGINSTVRKAANINRIGWDYNQLSIVATLHLSPETEKNDTAWQRFLPTSTIAMLPLTDSLSSLVWSADVPLAKRLMSMTEESFVEEINSTLFSDTSINRSVASLTNTVSRILQSIKQSGPSARQLPPKVTGIDPDSRQSFKVGLGHATKYVAPRVALIGDAAHQVHPHAGQGANLGFGDVQLLQETLHEAVSSGSDIGSSMHLLLYEQHRQCQVVPIITAIDLLYRQFKTSFTPIVALRSVAAEVINSNQSIKELLMTTVN